VQPDANLATGRTLRGRLAPAGRAGDHGLGALVRAHRAAYPRPDARLLRRAYELAERMHRGQTRESGEPFITHPIAVATILAEFGMDPIALTAALLHDTVEDTALTLEDVEEQFGAEVTHLVDGVTKLDKIGFETREDAEAETVRKLLVAASKDLRVLVIKLVDRVHNLRTLSAKSEASQQRIARFTLEVLVPLANRLGIHVIKRELEDIAFATLDPVARTEIARLLEERTAEREAWFDAVCAQAIGDLHLARTKASVTARSRHLYSVYERWCERDGHIDAITDAARLLIVVGGDASDCYAALGVVHARWAAVAGRFKDYIALPRFNLYQSLHTTVLGPDSKPIEVLIRTEEMHRVAEHGIAAHLRAAAATQRRRADRGLAKLAARRAGDHDRDLAGGTPPPPGSGAAVRPAQLDWLRRLLEWQRETADPRDFLRGFKTDLEPDDVLVFTPKGEMIALPSGATVIDFAYAVHTDIGHSCVGARVNQRLVPLEYAVSNGDTIEILTATGGIGPSRDWLQIAITPRARNKIRQGLARQERQAASRARGPQEPREQRFQAQQARSDQRERRDDQGRRALRDQRGQRGLPDAGGERGREDARLRSDAVVEAASTPARERVVAVEPDAIPPDRGVIVKDLEDARVRLARCCTPAPRDPIIGFALRGQGVSIHRVECPNAEQLQRTRRTLVEVGWAPSSTTRFAVTVQVESLDRIGLLHDITGVLADHGVGVLSANITTDTDRIATLRFTLELTEITRLRPVVAAINTVEGVYDAYRVIPESNDGRSRHPLEEVSDRPVQAPAGPAAPMTS
jgi:GTP diphosphokinase / guanosine-3',5'-bis(diphosphate) 3'-diphosphatase